MASLVFDVSGLRDAVGRFLNGVAYADATAAEKIIIDNFVNNGYRQFLFPPVVSGARITRWSFLPVDVSTVTALDDANPNPLGGAAFSELILESCLAVAELHENDKKGEHWERFMVMLVSANVRDRMESKVRIGAVERTWDGLKAAVGAFLFGEDSTGWTTTQESEVEAVVNSGYRRFLFPVGGENVPAGYEWSFMRAEASVTTEADDQAQDLPAAFGRLLGDLTFAPEIHVSPVVLVSAGRMAILQQQSEDTDRPKYAVVRYKESEEGAAQVQEIVWWPVPDDAYVLYYRHEAFSGNLSDSFSCPLGGPEHGELLLESCLAMAHETYKTGKNIHQEKFNELLVSAVRRDQKRGASYYGPMGGSETKSLPHRLQRSSYEITYDGETW